MADDDKISGKVFLYADMHTDPYDAYTIQMPTMSVVQMVHGSLSSAHQIANELRNVGEEREKKTCKKFLRCQIRTFNMDRTKMRKRINSKCDYTHRTTHTQIEFLNTMS